MILYCSIYINPFNTGSNVPHSTGPYCHTIRVSWRQPTYFSVHRLGHCGESLRTERVKKECIQIIIHAWLFFSLQLYKFNVLHNPSSSQHSDRPHYSFKCNIESQHFTQMQGRIQDLKKEWAQGGLRARPPRFFCSFRGLFKDFDAKRGRRAPPAPPLWIRA